MTVTLLTSQSAPTATDAEALVIGVFQGADGPVPSPDIDEFDLMGALTALGATGKPEELTKIPTAGRLATPVIAAVGILVISSGLPVAPSAVSAPIRSSSSMSGTGTGPSAPWNTPMTRASASVAVGADWLVSKVTVILLIVGHRHARVPRAKGV